MDTDIFRVFDDVRYLFKTQFIFFVRNKIFFMSLSMFYSVLPKENILIRRENISKFRIFFNDRFNDIWLNMPNRNIFQSVIKNISMQF